MFALLAHVLVSAQDPAPPPTAPEETVVITGTKPRPDPDKQHIPLGSRIARESDGEGFQSIASNTGLQGLISAGSAGFDATGGSVPTWRRDIVTECKASDKRVSAKLACSLAPVEKAIEAGDFASADARLNTLKPPLDTNSAEHYFIAYYRYLVAAHFGDDAGREQALKQIVATGELLPADSAAAHKTLAALALKRGDDADAIKAYEQLLASAPAEPKVQANLAALHDRQGETGIAVRYMREAVSLIRLRGQNPPEDWVQFLIERP